MLEAAFVDTPPSTRQTASKETKKLATVTTQLENANATIALLEKEKLKLKGKDCKECKRLTQELSKTTNEPAGSVPVKTHKALESRATKAEKRAEKAEKELADAVAVARAKPDGDSKAVKEAAKDAKKTHDAQQSEIERLEKAIRDAKKVNDSEIDRLNKVLKSERAEGTKSTTQSTKKITELEKIRADHEKVAAGNVLANMQDTTRAAKIAEEESKKLGEVEAQAGNLSIQLESSKAALAIARSELREAKENVVRLTAEATEKSGVSEKAEAANKELSRKQSKKHDRLEKDNATLVAEKEKLQSELATLTRKLKKGEEKKTKLNLALTAQLKVSTELDALRKNLMKDLKAANSKLIEREIMDHTAKDKLGFYQSQLEKAEASAHKHEQQALRLQALDEARNQKSNPESEEPFRKTSRFVSPPPTRGGRSFLMSPIPMESLEGDSPSADEARMVLKRLSAKCTTNHTCRRRTRQWQIG